MFSEYERSAIVRATFNIREYARADKFNFSKAVFNMLSQSASNLQYIVIFFGVSSELEKMF